jgi:hypothetical protein
MRLTNRSRKMLAGLLDLTSKITAPTTSAMISAAMTATMINATTTATAATIIVIGVGRTTLGGVEPQPTS